MTPACVQCGSSPGTAGHPGLGTRQLRLHSSPWHQVVWGDVLPPSARLGTFSAPPGRGWKKVSPVSKTSAVFPVLQLGRGDESELIQPVCLRLSCPYTSKPFLFLLKKLFKPLLGITGLCSALVHPAGLSSLSDACPGAAASPGDIAAACTQTRRRSRCFPLVPCACAASPRDLCDTRPGLPSPPLPISPRVCQRPACLCSHRREVGGPGLQPRPGARVGLRCQSPFSLGTADSAPGAPRSGVDVLTLNIYSWAKQPPPFLFLTYIKG